jgi:hypothetical protein
MSSKSAWKDYLKKLMREVKWLNWRGRRSAFIRGREIKEILEKLSRYNLGIKEDRDLPREEFRGAVQRYVCGLYDDSMYRSLSAAEMGLLVRLNEVLSPEEKNSLHDEINRERRPRSFTFGVIANISEQKGILEGSLISLCNDLLRQRNSQVHTHNFIAAIISIQRKFLQEDSIKQAQDAITSLGEHGSFREKLVANFVRVWASRMMTPEAIQKAEAYRTMSDFQWCSKDNLRQTVELDVERFLEETLPVAQEVVSDLSELRLRRFMSSYQRLLEYSHKEAYMKKRAYDTLKDSYDFLERMQIF